jgi:hypothetical protein
MKLMLGALARLVGWLGFRFTLREVSSQSILQQNPSRLAHLDALRGLMLVFMAVNHIPSELQVATNHVFGFVSAAEGFVFLAGLLAGLVYTRKLDRSSFLEMRNAGFQRAAKVYRYHLAAYLVIFTWVFGFTLHTGTPPACSPALMHASPWLSILAGPFLVYQPGMLDILPMYCVFLLTLPFLLRWLEQGRRSQVLLGSLALWALCNAFIPQHPFISGLVNTGAFDPGAWQLLFVTGVVFGHARARNQVLLPAPRAWLLALMLTTATLLYAVRHAFLQPPWSLPLLDALANKNNLAPLRLINFALLAMLIHAAVSRFPGIMQSRPLAFLGRHSLPVFSAHVVIATMLLGVPSVFTETATSRWISAAILLGGMFAAAAFSQARSVRRASAPALPARLSWPAPAFLPHGERTAGAANPVHR